MLSWGKMWSDTHDNALKHIRITREESGQMVANAYSGDFWVRRPIGEMEDGLYTLNIMGGLQLAVNQKWTYPDLKLKMPTFSNMVYLTQFSPQVMEDVLAFLDTCTESRSQTNFYMGPQGLISGEYFDPEPDEDDAFNIPVDTRIRYDHECFYNLKEELSLSIKYFKIALTEMTMYPDQPVMLTREDYKDSPLVVGVSPSSCAVIALKDGRRGTL